MADDQFIFWTICLVSLFLAKLVTKCFDEPSMFLEAYGGCDCGNDDCIKIDTIDQRGKRYRRIDIQESKMSYKYCKIYNVSKGEWASDVSGNDDPNVIWETNEWDENDALIGYYSDNNGDYHNVIFCRPGYAIYVQSDSDFDKSEYDYDGTQYRIPPAMLVNLNDAFDTEFVHSKNYPEEMDVDSDSESETSDESDSESDDESTSEEAPTKAELEDNQDVMDFLWRCHNATDSPFKKAAYLKALEEIKWYFEPIRSQKSWKPCSIGPNIERKIREFIDGFPDDDIIHS